MSGHLRGRGIGKVAGVLYVLAATAAGIALLLPGRIARGRSENAVVVSTPPAASLGWSVTPASVGARPFGGIPTVGALFTTSAGRLAHHFCTAAVVHSVHGDLAVTAAHCLTRRTGRLEFVPGYASGKEPYGAWLVTAVYTTRDWRSAQDPDQDVAFLRLADTDGRPVEDVTGSERLGTGIGPPALVRVVAYPVKTDQPVQCVNRVRQYTPTQLEFDCGGYTNGTSGGPFLAHIADASGQSAVMGVIGGYEQGGRLSDVSYSPVFGPFVAGLYRTAEAGG